METIRWSNLRGFNRTIAPTALPSTLSPAMADIELVSGALGRRRPGLQEISLSSGPTGFVYYISTFMTAAAVAELWAFSGTSTVHRRVAGVWNLVTLIDTPGAFSSSPPHSATLNGKFFLAYNSASNRLHLWDGTVRRVGILKPAALTVADTGAGAYAATARRYRTSQRLKNGADIVAESELSDAVSFTPSGGGTAARITKSATVDGATHWVVWGLIGTSGDTYDLYEELAEIVVGTTTYDDSTNPASYSGDNPAPLGMHIPPPSVKYLATDGTRLLMAGAHETSASAGETTPKSSRVWFTRVLGASDIGDDESIPNTTDQKNWVDVGENDGDSITGLGGPINGIVYVFKTNSLWRLIPTSIDIAPYRPERVSSAVGAVSPSGMTSQYSIVVAEDEIGQPALYFWHRIRCFRISAAGSVESVADDLEPRIDVPVTTLDVTSGVFWGAKGQLVFSGLGPNSAIETWTYTPQLAVRDDTGTLRGGWSPGYPRFNDAVNSSAVYSMTLYPIVNSTLLEPIFGGGTGGNTAHIGYWSTLNNSGSDAFGAFTPSITSAPMLLGEGARNVTCENPLLQAAVTASATPSVSYIRDFGAETITAVAPALTASGSETRKTVKVEGLQIADAVVVQVKLTWDTDQFTANNRSEMTDAITVPYTVKDAR